MPKSSKEGKEEILEWCRSLPNINNIVDVGAGGGTYHKLLAKKNKIFPSASWTAIEAWTDYISKFSLNEKYSTVINQDVRTVDFTQLGDIDLTIMGDVLEHMTKEEAIKLVSNVAASSRFAIISIPIIHYPQDAHEGNPYEIHVKDDWSHQEVIDTFSNITKLFQGTEIGCYLLEFKK